ncbi:uncharacterized protein DUF3515 [Actinomadura pelletieri DSM 43383]|uniref:Uncharacterized protein DUF3515 n=1 Tax=Actinomadura pelletieri DSM 43383 TaxID=1120940 RepID=A0A495QGA1_9ACTN|nr:DUF3515 domain-containing protein [Actinomadura pelletieri]RKS70894.1 uncharacterized protein DUF3515 [Actinomadura pelletieri DSM 43383]
MRTLPGVSAALALAATITGCGAGVVQVPVPRPDVAAAELCKRLKLPDKVHGRTRREVSPRSTFTAAWGSPAIALRCGVPLPRHDMRAMIAVINGVQWLPTPQTRPVTFTAVGRKAYVEVTIPHSYTKEGSAAGEILMEFNPAVQAAMPEKPEGEL